MKLKFSLVIFTAALVVALTSALRGQNISFYTSGTVSGTAVGDTKSLGSTTVTLNQASPILVSANAFNVVTTAPYGTKSGIFQLTITITSSNGTNEGSFVVTNEVSASGFNYGENSSSGSYSTGTLPVDTYTISFSDLVQSVSLEANGININWQGSCNGAIIITQNVSPQVQAAIDAATAAFNAGQTSLANQLASLINTVSALQAQVNGLPSNSGLASQVASLQTQLTALTDQTNAELNDLRSQVGAKQDQQSFLSKYGPAFGAGVAGIGGSLLIEHLISPSSGDSGAPPPTNPTARPGYYDR